MRKFGATIILACCLVPLWQSPAVAATSRNTIVVWLDHTTIRDWTRPGLTHFAQLLATGSSGLVWTLPAVSRTDAVTLRASAARALRPTGVVIGDADGRNISERFSAVQLAPSRKDSSFPDGMRTDVHATIEAARITLAAQKNVLIDLGDFARVERALGTDPIARAPWIERSMANADAILGALMSMRGGATLIVISPDASVLRERDRIRLGVFAATGSSFPMGLLDRSVEGFVTLSEAAALFSQKVAPTLSSAPDPAGFLNDLDRGAVVVSRARPALLAISLLGPGILIALLLVLIATGTRAHIARLVIKHLLLACAFLPVSIFLSSISIPSTTAGLLLISTTRALIAGLLAVPVFRYVRAMQFTLLFTLVLTCVDVATGGNTLARSPLAVPLAAGAHQPGVDAGVAGLMIGAALVAAGLLIDKNSRLALPVALGFVSLAILLGARSLGDQPGVVFALIPAAGLLIARAVDRWDVRALLATSSVTLAIASVISLHGSKPNISNAVSARLHSVLHHLSGVWPPAIVLAAIPAAAFFVKKRDIAERALWGRPGARAALVAACVAAGISTFAIPGGLATAAWILVFATTSVGTLLPERQTR